MKWSTKASLASSLAVEPLLTKLLAELFERTHQANHLVEHGFKLLAIFFLSSAAIVSDNVTWLLVPS
jgi:hypothetical protein